MWADLCGGTCILRLGVGISCLLQLFFILCLEIPRLMAAYAGKNTCVRTFIKTKTKKPSGKQRFR